MENPMIAEDTKQNTENQPALKLTKKAIQQVKALLEKEGVTGCGLRVSVSSGGCSGFSLLGTGSSAFSSWLFGG